MHRADPYLSKPKHFVSLFKDLRRKLDLIDKGPRTPIESYLLEDLPTQDFRQLRSKVRKQVLGANLSTAKFLLNSRSEHQIVKRKTKADTRYILKKREEQYRDAFLENGVHFMPRRAQLQPLTPAIPKPRVYPRRKSTPRPL